VIESTQQHPPLAASVKRLGTETALSALARAQGESDFDVFQPVREDYRERYKDV
jgi:hypothetical protein